MLLHPLKKVAFSCLCFVGVLILLPPTAGQPAPFTQVPPSVLYVMSGKTAKLMWDYDLGNVNKDTTFAAYSPVWKFDSSSTSETNVQIAYEYKWSNPIKWQWIIAPTCPEVLKDRIHKESNATLVISNVTTADNGTYICTLTLMVPSTTVSTHVQLIITVVPQILPLPPSPYYIKEDDDLSINCSAIGPPVPRVTWVKSDKTVISNDLATSMLVIRNIKRSHKGTYRCLASNNPNEDPVHTEITVVVMYIPVIDKSRSSTKFNSWNGNSIRLKCLATGLPSPQILWYKPTNKQITTGVDIVPGGSEVTVTTTIDQGDYGQYKCRATNIVGSDVHIINVAQLLTPGAVDITAAEIEASSIAVRWNKPAIDGGRPVTGYLLEITTKPPIATGSTYAVITGLEKSTLYTVKVYANNGIGYGMPSTTNITTKKKGKPSVPLLSVTLLQSTGSQLSVSFKWTKPDDNGETITKYTIYMKDVTSQHDWTKIKDILKLSNLEYTITKNIEIGKTYKFIVTAWNKYGESVKDDWNAKTVNTTADKATYTSDKAVSSNTGKETKYTIVIGVITAILVISTGLNILQFVLFWRKNSINERSKKKNTQIRKSQPKATKEEIYDNDLEMEDTTLPVVTAPSEKQSRNTVPEYETIQDLSGRTSFKERSRTSQVPTHYQGLNLPSNISTQEGQRPMYQPLSAASNESDNEQHPYESLGLRNQSSDYQSLHTNGRESVI